MGRGLSVCLSVCLSVSLFVCMSVGKISVRMFIMSSLLMCEALFHSALYSPSIYM